MPGGINFDDDEDDGIFADPEQFAANDPIAKLDIGAQSDVPMLTLGRGEDGFALLAEEDRSILDPPERVDAKCFICLGGPCRHYTENARLVPEGPAPGADDNIEVGRWCGRVRTWAEQLDLSEAKIYACTSYEPTYEGDPAQVRAALEQNARVIAGIKAQRLREQADIGICALGPCKDFVEMLVKLPKEQDQESRRWCLRLGGLGRLYDLRERPVKACTGWMPVASSPELAGVALGNAEQIAQCRKEMAERPNIPQEGDDAED